MADFQAPDFLQLDDLLAEEEKLARDTVRDFVGKEFLQVLPITPREPSQHQPRRSDGNGKFSPHFGAIIRDNEALDAAGALPHHARAVLGKGDRVAAMRTFEVQEAFFSYHEDREQGLVPRLGLEPRTN